MKTGLIKFNARCDVCLFSIRAEGIAPVPPSIEFDRHGLVGRHVTANPSHSVHIEEELSYEGDDWEASDDQTG